MPRWNASHTERDEEGAEPIFSRRSNCALAYCHHVKKGQSDGCASAS